jgi:hypothetical protein
MSGEDHQSTVNVKLKFKRQSGRDNLNPDCPVSVTFLGPYSTNDTENLVTHQSLLSQVA